MAAVTTTGSNTGIKILLMYSTHEPTARHVRTLQAMEGVRAVAVAHSEDEALREARDAHVILGHRYLRQTLPGAAALRWVQSTAGGIDALPLAALAARSVRLARMTVSSITIARHAVALAWALNRKLPDALRRQQEGVWDASHTMLPAPRRALVLGTGAIGAAIGARLQAEGVRVAGVNRGDGATAPRGFDQVLGSDAWRGALPSVDWCFMALPSTPETRRLFGAAELDALPPTAILVNVGRGETLDTQALTERLERGRLGGAGLDVIDPKPRGADDPVWRTPNLILTAHVAAHSAERAAQIEDEAEAQVQRFLRGEPLENEVQLGAAAGP